jgi:hypothetical protein
VEQLLNYLYPAVTKAPNSVYSGGVSTAEILDALGGPESDDRLG